MKYSLLILVSLSTMVLAIPLDHFYAASVNVESRDKNSFKRAAKQAAINVLVKASGQNRAFVISDPRIARDLEEAYRWVEQFSYNQQAPSSLAGKSSLMLTMQFPEKRVADWLEKGGLRLWLNNRPVTLILSIVQDVSQQKRSQGQETKLQTQLYSLVIGQSASDRTAKLSPEHDMATALVKYSKQLGLPIVGLSKKKNKILEVNSKKVSRLWQFNSEQIQKLGRTIENDAIFTARIAITGSKRFVGTWFLLENDSRSYVDINAGNADEFVAKGFAWLAKHYSKQYAMRLQSAHDEYTLTIQSIDKQEHYQNMMNYLEKHELIKEVYLLEASGSSVTVSLLLKTDIAQLEKAFLLDKKLQKLDCLTECQLDYQWVIQ